MMLLGASRARVWGVRRKERVCNLTFGGIHQPGEDGRRVVRPRALEREIPANQIDNIRRFEDTFDCFSWDHSHGSSVNRLFGFRQPWVTFFA